MRIAFAGFRHGHILGLHKLACEHPGVEVVAASEPDAEARRALAEAGQVKLTHDSHERMIRETDCDAVAIGDVYGLRGPILIAALKAGRHVISDKPICTRPEDLEQIAELASSRGLSVGAQLDLRSMGVFRAMRRLISEGAVGEVHTVCFTGQHPLLYGTRPAWYFEPGMQGGTINDIAIHGIDAVGWLAGRRVAEVVAARAWNARLKEVPFFQDAAQLLLRLDNGGGALGDVSYFAPAYSAPQYWRITCHGPDGVIEAAASADAVVLQRAGDKEPQRIDPDPDRPAAYFGAFLAEAAGQRDNLDLTTNEIIQATRATLAIQQAADQNKTHVALA
ncbi:MAG TPA: Gfo/Idh/MocA family oxidoreductase [Phycisphaerae bacterium]|nr:Gfo/Idh/MocA family oxidoreductase [Phycisphaerae bacterium]